MKKIIFVMPKFGAGGAEKSLLMLLFLLNKFDEVSVDVLFFKKEGIFLSQIPEKINIVDADESLKTAYSKFDIKNIKNIRTFLISVIRPFATLIAKVLSKNDLHKGQLRWKWFYKGLIKNLDEPYDYACGYLDGEALYYVVDKIVAKTKYGWNQNDYRGLCVSEKFDSRYYDKLDKIVTLSDMCMTILKEVFPHYVNKMLQIPPIVTQEFINDCANKFIPKEYRESDGIRIISVGRLVKQKGFDMAIEAAQILSSEGIRFKWFIIGNGELYEELRMSISKKNLNDKVILLGEHGNPYPYIKNADVFIQPSRYEGKSVVLNETKMLAKLIIATSYPTVIDQIQNGMDGIIVGMNAESIARGIVGLMNDKELQERIRKNLLGMSFEDKELINAYMELFDLI